MRRTSSSNLYVHILQNRRKLSFVVPFGEDSFTPSSSHGPASLRNVPEISAAAAQCFRDLPVRRLNHNQARQTSSSTLALPKQAEPAQRLDSRRVSLKLPSWSVRSRRLV